MQHDPALSSLNGFGLQKRPRALGVPLTPSLGLGPRLSRFIARAVLGLALLILATAGSLLWLRHSYDDRVYPAIHVGGVNIGGESIDDAREHIRLEATQIENSRATFTFGDKQWTPTLAELGISIDAEQSLDEAIAFGREGDARDRMRSTWSLIRNDRQIPFVVTVDEPTLNAWFDQVNTDLGISPHDATLAINDGKVSIVPEVAGTVVDRAQLKNLVLAAAANLQAPTTALATVDFAPSIFAADLADEKQALEQALAKPVEVTYKRQSWTLDPEDLSQFVVFPVDESNGTKHVTMTLDRKELGKWLSSFLSDEVNSDAVDAKVGWNGERVVSVEQSVDGAKLKPSTLAEAVATSFFGGHDKVEIPVAVVKPDIDSNNLAALGITTRLAVGTSNFDGSDDGRATNIIVGANILNGTLIPPHSSFSFNHSVGVINEDAGFVESSVVDGERIGRDVGGGICQVSTTVFRAAFKAGLPIEEWNPHRYRMGFYEADDWDPGLDASILQPEGDPFSGGDFIFTNPSDSYMLMESYTDGPRVVIIIYGPDLGYKVNVTGPVFGETYKPTEDVEVVQDDLPAGTIQQSEYAQEGLDVSFTRQVLDRDGNEIENRDFYTHFYPRGNVYQVSPDMAGQSPAAFGS